MNMDKRLSDFLLKQGLAKMRKQKRIEKSVMINAGKPVPPTDKQLDAMCRRITVELRDKNKCCHCGKTEALSASHVFPKGTYKRLRWDIDNVKALCYRCHMHWWHKDPEASDWFKAKYPERWERLKLLKDTAGYIDRFAIKLYLEQEIKRLENAIM